MDERKNKQNHLEPWDDGTYETGRFHRPRGNHGFLAVMLIAVIFLSGISSMLSILNIQLLGKIRKEPPEPDAATFYNIADFEDPVAAMDREPTVPPRPEGIPSGAKTSLWLNQSPQSLENIPQAGAVSWQDIYEKNIVSTVSITGSGKKGSGSGTGVVISPDGYLVTNAHVVASADQIQVQLTDERTFPARLIGQDTVSDLAVLHIDAKDLTAAEFGDSAALRVGDAVAAIGDPLGLELRGSFTDGIVSAINRDVTIDGRTMTLIQTNAALNSGNSGGPLINCFGQVIGINTMKISSFTDHPSVEGLGFAIPSTTVKEIVDQLISLGYVSGRPYLGLDGEPVSLFYQNYYRLPPGLFINTVSPDSPAKLIGIETGDIVLSIDGNRIHTMEDLNSVLFSHKPGDSMTLLLYRAGHQYRATVTLAEATK